MVRRYMLLAVIFLFLCVNVTLAQTSGLTVPSYWQNQRGSILHLNGMDAAGHVVGQYTNKAQGYPCQATYPLVGWIYDNGITFTVAWVNDTESCNSLTSWTGHYNNGAITTQWLLVNNSSGVITKGEDIFGPCSEADASKSKPKSPNSK